LKGGMAVAVFGGMVGIAAGGVWWLALRFMCHGLGRVARPERMGADVGCRRASDRG